MPDKERGIQSYFIEGTMGKTTETYLGAREVIETQDSLFGLVTYDPKSFIKTTLITAGQSFILQVNVPAHATATNAEVVLNANAPFKFDVLDVWGNTTTHVASSTIALDDGVTAISNTFASNTTLPTVLKTTTLDKAVSTIAANGTLRFLGAGGSTRAAFKMNILCMRVL